MGAARVGSTLSQAMAPGQATPTSGLLSGACGRAPEPGTGFPDQKSYQPLVGSTHLYKINILRKTPFVDWGSDHLRYIH